MESTLDLELVDEAEDGVTSLVLEGGLHLISTVGSVVREDTTVVPLNTLASRKRARNVVALSILEVLASITSDGGNRHARPLGLNLEGTTGDRSGGISSGHSAHGTTLDRRPRGRLHGEDLDGTLTTNKEKR